MPHSVSAPSATIPSKSDSRLRTNRRGSLPRTPTLCHHIFLCREYKSNRAPCVAFLRISCPKDGRLTLSRRHIRYRRTTFSGLCASWEVKLRSEKHTSQLHSPLHL